MTREIKFAENLEKLIKEQGYTKKAFALKMGIQESQVHNYTKGINNPNLVMLCDLATGLNVTLDELVYGDKKCEKTIWI